MMLLLKERHLKRQDREHLVDIALYILYTPLLPGPNLRRYVVIDWYVGLGMNILGNIEIKARIVDKNKSIRLPLYDVALAHGHILEDSVQMQEHRNKTHIGKFAVMSHTLASYSRHKVAAKEAKLGVVVNLFKRQLFLPRSIGVDS